MQKDLKFLLYTTPSEDIKINAVIKDETLWLTQKAMAELFGTSPQNITLHLKNIYDEKELIREATCKDFLQVQNEGGRKVKRNITFYSLDMILAVGFRVRSPRGVQFRRWANSTLKEYMQKGFVIDDDRLKNPDGRPDYFDELLERIRDIRASEKRFYQKLRDLFALSSDYDKTDRATQLFFAEVQNKLIYGVTGKTAADLIMARADASKQNMSLTSWSGSVVRKRDILIAKNYLTADEIDTLNRLVTIFLESAELRVKMRKDLTLPYWRGTVDKLLEDHGVPVLADRGSHSHDEMIRYVTDTYAEFDARRKKYNAQKADADDLAELEREIPAIKHRKQ